MPRKHRRSKPRTGYISDEHLSGGVENMMQHPGFNAEWVPDVIEYYVHKKVVETILATLANAPPIELYGHLISLHVVPKQQ